MAKAERHNRDQQIDIGVRRVESKSLTFSKLPISSSKQIQEICRFRQGRRRRQRQFDLRYSVHRPELGRVVEIGRSAAKATFNEGPNAFFFRLKSRVRTKFGDLESRAGKAAVQHSGLPRQACLFPLPRSDVRAKRVLRHEVQMIPHKIKYELFDARIHADAAVGATNF